MTIVEALMQDKTCLDYMRANDLISTGSTMKIAIEMDIDSALRMLSILVKLYEANQRTVFNKDERDLVSQQIHELCDLVQKHCHRVTSTRTT